MVTIVQHPNAILREVTPVIPHNQITLFEVQETIKHLQEALASQPDGVAIAAPQIGSTMRIFIASPKAYQEGEMGPLVFINPTIIKSSKKMEIAEEGCLSIRWIYGDVERHKQVTVRAYDEHGNQFERGASGFLARVFQHEIDHLDGILFIDKALTLRELTPEEVASHQKELQNEKL